MRIDLRVFGWKFDCFCGCTVQKLILLLISQENATQAVSMDENGCAHQLDNAEQNSALEKGKQWSVRQRTGGWTIQVTMDFGLQRDSVWCVSSRFFSAGGVP